MAGVLLDAFETIVLPRRVARRLRLTRMFYQGTWGPWAALARRRERSDRRENFLGFYGPLSLLVLLGVWAVALITGFGLLQFALGSALIAPEGAATLSTDLYLSGTTFFTLGLGDVTPRTSAARLLTVIEGGTGFAFLGLVVGYLPVLYQGFSRREVSISLLDARAGSPPTAAELLRRHCPGADLSTVVPFLQDWERWAAELLESHLSYPVLGYFRSQHENQSWLAALTMILDACAVIIVGSTGPAARAARLTFAMARHAAVDLAQVFSVRPRPMAADRLPPADLARLRGVAEAVGAVLAADPAAETRLTELRAMYEPYVAALADYLLMPLPPWLPPAEANDNWQATAWDSAGGPRLL